MANLISIAYDKKSVYPGRESSFSPATAFPEYPWDTDTLSGKPNCVYSLVRESLKLAGFDWNHYDLPEWNPLGDIIEPGNVVLIKPNWVENKNKNPKVNDNLACLVTNPSVVRAITDYVVIALKGKGKIIIGDAPMQACDLQEVFSITGYTELFRFYRRQGIEIEVDDMRKYSVSGKYRGVLTKPEKMENSMGSIYVELGSRSMHAENDSRNPLYKVTDYKLSDTRKYHFNEYHSYEISKIPLEADVIINVPKPKTHRLAGMTAAIKNMVGITYEKACLPHRMEGDKKHGGDAYLKKSLWKQEMHCLDEKRTEASINGNYLQAKIYDYLMKSCYVMGAICSRDSYRIGSWYGNDTIWRTAVDLNYILLYADQKGNLCNSQQRRILTIADMIICGEKEGPVSPTPKPLGMIMVSDNSLLFDRVMCEIMGFDALKFPLFHHNKALNCFGYFSERELEKELIITNLPGQKVVLAGKFTGKEEWFFEAHPCWKGYIEKCLPKGS